MGLITDRIEATASSENPAGHRRGALKAPAAMTAVAASLSPAPSWLRPPSGPSARGYEQRAYLLVASPDIFDPIFQQAVILVVPPSEPLLVAGIVINEPTKMEQGRGIENPDEEHSSKKK